MNSRITRGTFQEVKGNWQNFPYRVDGVVSRRTHCLLSAKRAGIYRTVRRRDPHDQDL